MPTAARTRYAIREILSLIGMGVALFWSAGRLDWWPAWASLAVMTVWTAATAFIVLRYHPALLAERLGTRQGRNAGMRPSLPSWALSPWCATSSPVWISVTAGRAN